MKISSLNIDDYSDVEIVNKMFDNISDAEWEQYFLGQKKFKVIATLL